MSDGIVVGYAPRNELAHAKREEPSEAAANEAVDKLLEEVGASPSSANHLRFGMGQRVLASRLSESYRSFTHGR